MLLATAGEVPAPFAEALRGWLPAQRWWPGDADWESATRIELTPEVTVWLLRTAGGVTVQVPLAVLPASAPAAPVAAGVISLASRKPIAPPPGQIAVVECAGELVHLVDATHDEGYHRALLAHARVVEPWLRASSLQLLVPEAAAGQESEAQPPADRVSEAHRYPDLDQIGAVLAVEQSNTSIIMPRVHHGVIVKVLRCVVDGDQPDLDVPNSLAAVGFAHVPRTYAVLEAAVEDGRFLAGWQATLAIISQLVPDAEDGFTRACAMAASDLPMLADIAALGADLADMHAALRRAFAVEITSTHEVLSAIGERIEDSATRSDEVRGLLGPIDTYLEQVRRGVPDAPVSAQRLHGDLHLGQTLWSPHGWWVLDFEGEPLRPLSARVAPDLPERDLAGVLRSIDYAVALSDASPAWGTDARAALLNGYYDHTTPRDVRHPRLDSQSQRLLLEAFELDKAAYEVGYEKLHRPRWQWVPEAALTRILEPYL